MEIKRLDTPGFGEALQLAMTNAPLVRHTETIGLWDALGRVTAEEIVCRKDLPAFDNSAMDGFAVKAGDAGKRVRVVATILAGMEIVPCLEDGTCYKIMTGAKVPEDADCVVPIEKCPELGEDWVRLPETIKKGDNLRKRGEEQKVGAVLIEKGECLTPAHIAMLSAQGITAVKVYTPLRIAVASSGSELKEPWEEADARTIYNANGFGVIAFLKRAGFSPSYIGSIPDEKEATIRFIGELKGYDVIITTGGISMGEADYLAEAFEANGMQAPLFHGVNVKPGRPTMMGLMGQTFVMAMPGNPLTTLLNLFLLSIPVLNKMQGNRHPYYPYVTVQNAAPFKAKPTRANLVLGKLIDGKFHAVRNNKVGSGMLTPLMEADCVAVFEAGRKMPEAGEDIKVILFDIKPSSELNDAYNIP
ncbi:MAG: molybdopterin molybdotransferase MoeA [Epsilonproteobacteria bacterium]|nr:molybdopterin molybdotransferase MoeA [Campylobacterota bacterium]